MVDAAAASRVAGAVFADRAARERLPSIAWGIVERGELIASGGDAHASYRIASMTKSFTASVVLSLRDEGVLRLDEPIATYAPELATVRSATTDAPPITVRHLLTMSSGLATDDAWADRHMDIADDELDALLHAGTGYAAATGTVFEYSNLGYGLLGRVVLRASGRRVQDLVSERLLGPLGMTDTSWTPPPGAMTGYRKRTLNDPEELVEEPFVADGSIAPMGGLFSTVADLAKWIGFFTDAFPARDDVDDGPLRRSSRREMQQVSRAYTDMIGGYGMGLNVLQHATAGTVVTHSGGLPGFGSNMRWLPAQGVGVIALANSTYAWMARATAEVLDALMADRIIGTPQLEPSAALRAAAEALVALHNEWDDERAAALFSDNVAPDLPLAKRREAAEELRTEHGPFTVARVVAESGTSGVVVAHGPHAELTIDFQLAPAGGGRVQLYDTSVEA